MCQRGWSCCLTHCFTEGEKEAQRRGRPMGPSRVVAEPVQGSWSADLHSMLLLYIIHPLPSAPEVIISSWQHQVLDLGTNEGKMASAVIRVFSGGKGSKEPTGACASVHCSAPRELWDMSHSTPAPGGTSSTHDLLDYGLLEGKEAPCSGTRYSCDTPGVSAQCTLKLQSPSGGKQPAGGHSSALPILSGKACLHWLMPTWPCTV